MAPKFPPETKLNWLLKDEWETIKRALFPNVRYDDVLKERLIKKWEESEQTQFVCCCRRNCDRRMLSTSDSSFCLVSQECKVSVNFNLPWEVLG